MVNERGKENICLDFNLTSQDYGKSELYVFSLLSSFHVSSLSPFGVRLASVE